jgi:hypothetical protein
MRWQTSAMPKNVAPARFYAPEYTQAQVNSAAYNGAYIARQLMAQGIGL